MRVGISVAVPPGRTEGGALFDASCFAALIREVLSKRITLRGVARASADTPDARTMPATPGSDCGLVEHGIASLRSKLR